MIYHLSFLSRATTGIVSRAFAANLDGEDGNIVAVREAASALLTVSVVCVILISILYALCTPKMLSVLHVDPFLILAAKS